MASTVTIAGVNVVAYVREYTIDLKRGVASGQATLSVIKKIEDVLTLSPGQAIVIVHSYWGTCFSGYIDSVVKETGGQWKIVARDKLVLAMNTNINNIYEDTGVTSGYPYKIFEAICDTCGLSYTDGTTIQIDTGTVLSTFICNNRSAFDRLQKLAEVMNYQFYYRADTDKVYFEPIGYTANSYNLVVGSTSNNVCKIPEWKEDTGEMINEVYLFATPQLVSTTQFFNGTGAQTTFTTTYMFDSIKVLVGGVLKKGGPEGSTTAANYFTYKDKKQIVFQVGSVPAVGVNNVQVDYNYKANIPTIARNQASINTYGLHAKSVFLGEALTMDDAEEYASQMVAKYSQPFNMTSVKWLRMPAAALFKPGDVVYLNDTARLQTGTYVVQGLTIRYPYPYDDIAIGDKEYRVSDYQTNTDKRIRKIEDDQSSSSDRVRRVIECSENFVLDRYQIQIVTRAVEDSFILGLGSNGLHYNATLGRGKLGDRRGTPTLAVNTTY
jgi:hypothetical protein